MAEHGGAQTWRVLRLEGGLWHTDSGLTTRGGTPKMMSYARFSIFYVTSHIAAAQTKPLCITAYPVQVQSHDLAHAWHTLLLTLCMACSVSARSRLLTCPLLWLPARSTWLPAAPCLQGTAAAAEMQPPRKTSARHRTCSAGRICSLSEVFGRCRPIGRHARPSIHQQFAQRRK